MIRTYSAYILLAAIASISLCFNTQAQERFSTASRQTYYAAERYNAAHFAGDAAALYKHAGINAARSDSFGYTYYDVQTRYSMPERINYDPERKLVQVVWMAASDAELQNRGSYYGIFDVSGESPEKLNGWQRIEVSNSGWPNLCTFSDGTIGVSAHSPAMFTKNISVLQEGFTTYPTGTASSFFPRSAVGADDVVHMIYTFISGNKLNHLGYLRSQDSGKTWSSEILLTGSTAPGGNAPKAADFDTYTIAARGQDVVVAYVDRRHTLWARRSADNGKTWGNAEVIMQPEYSTLHLVEDLPGNAVRFVSDTVATPGFDFDLIIDSNGKAHFAFSVLQTYISGEGVDNGSGIERNGTDTVYSDRMALRSYGIGYIAEGDAAYRHVAGPAGKSWNGNGVFPAALREAANLTATPQLALGANNELYCVFTSVKNDDVLNTEINGAPVDALYGHVYATRQLADKSWTPALDLTPAATDAQYAAVANIVDDKLYIAYQSDAVPGTRVGTELPLERNTLHLLVLPVADLDSVQTSVPEPGAQPNGPLAWMHAAPNPFAATTAITFMLESAQDVDMVLHDALGNTLAVWHKGLLPAGEHTVEIAARALGLPVGSYYCTLRCGRQAITRALVFAP